LLRARRERPSGCAAEQRDELAPFHSITSWASASSVGGTSRPRVLAVWALMTSSNFDVCCPERRRDRAPAINASLGEGRVVPIGNGIAAPKRPHVIEHRSDYDLTGQTTI